MIYPWASNRGGGEDFLNLIKVEVAPLAPTVRARQIPGVKAMHVWLEQKYGSLLQFRSDLGKFTVVTGLNGSGKSQLLNGLHTGAIKCDLYETSNSPVPPPTVLFTADDFKIKDQPGGQRFDQLSSREDLIRSAVTRNEPLRSEWYRWGASNGLSVTETREHTRETLKGPTSESTKKFAAALHSVLLKLRDRASPTNVYSPSAGMSDGTEIFAIAQQRTGLPYYLLTEEEIRENNSDMPALFDVSVGRIFSEYRHLQLVDDLRRVRRTYGESTADPLSGEEFEQQHGRPPWEVLNTILYDMGIDARFEAPERTKLDYSPAKLLTSDGTSLSPEQLSSGEKVILKLAVCGYLARSKFKPNRKPLLALLDEVDAPLHPAMVRTYLKVINDVLIDDFGMHVIATTHSPSTIAQCDQEAVCIMTKGQPGLARISKDRAIAGLSAGVPTLSVSLNDRRQIFAESPIEAKNLDALYQILKPSLASPISLQFMATGSTHSNSSKADVIRIVNDLKSAGNTTVYGLIDWDLSSKPTDRIRVLAEGRRYALENIILDPVVLAAELYRLLPTSAAHFGLDPSISVYDLKYLDVSKWQELVDAVTTRVLGSDPLTGVPCSYHGGMSLNVDKRYLEHPAHPLEDAIVKAYPVFENVKNAGSGKLTAQVTQTTLLKMPELIPKEIEDAFMELLAS